jgi:hypothetical protein
MKTVEQIKKAFREARIAGEQKLSRGETTWEEFCFVMVGFEQQLREMGVVL